MRKIAIVGYGNIGKALETEAKKYKDLELKYVFSRRKEEQVKTFGTRALPYSEILKYKDELDCLILAGSSITDLERQSPFLAHHFNIVDSYDLHHNGTNHRKIVGNSAFSGKKTAIVCAGWDPGLLSVIRSYFSSFMPYATQNTFWGKGVSQGHSAALRSIPGVLMAVQYTVPKAEAIEAARQGIECSGSDSHKRICYIVAKPGKEDDIRRAVFAMEGYFKSYDTEVIFTDEEEFLRSHNAMYHKGVIISSGMSGRYSENREVASLTLELGSNPEFTANILLAASRAAIRLHDQKMIGSYTFLDVAPKYFSDADPYIYL